MSDVRLFHTADGGDIAIASPNSAVTDVELDTGLETAAYLSMFGGNERDPGLLAGDVEGPTRYQWWGNLGEPLERQQRSETQYLLRSLPAVSGNLLRIEDAASRDLQWFLDTDLASEVEVTATLSNLDTVTISVRIVIRDQDFAFAFAARWGS